MKTKILVLAALLFGGLLFTSCQKDDALLEDNATEQLNVKDNFVDDHLSQWAFTLGNYPDPFCYSTTIEYHLPQSAFVELYVNPPGVVRKIVLVNEFQRKGVHKFKFIPRGLPNGQYIVYLKAGNRYTKDIMTKGDIDIDFDRPDYK